MIQYHLRKWTQLSLMLQMRKYIFVHTCCRSPHGERGLKYIAEIVAVVVIERRYCLLGLILLSITAFTRVGASKVDHDAHGIVVEEHHAEHWAALSGAEPGHFPGKPIIISSLWETISDQIDFLRRIVYN